MDATAMTELAFLNGTFSRVEDAKVSIEDRGFQFGDGVYEVIAVYDRQPFLPDQHMQRLRRSLEAIELDYDLDAAPLEPIIHEGIRRSHMVTRGMVYIQITRGTAPRTHAPPDDLAPTVVLTFKPLPAVSSELRQRGARLMVVPDDRWAKCFVKAITLLPNILAKIRSAREGFDDAIFVTSTGEVRECTTANIFMVTGGEIIIPPRTESVLHGVTQGFVMQCAADLGLTVTEQAFDVKTMMRADELFLSSTTAEVLGITSVDDQTIADGQVGPITRRCYDEFQRRVRTWSEDTTETVAG